MTQPQKVQKKEPVKDLTPAQKRKLTGAAGTIIIHAFLLIVLLLTGLTTQVPYPESGGIEVALGMPEEGGPDNIPTSSTEQVAPPPSTSSSPDESITGSDEESPATEKENQDKKNDNADPNKSDNPAKTDNNNPDNTNNNNANQQKVDGRFGGLGKNNGGGQGGDKTGDKGRPDGVPGGDPDGDGGSGGGTGGGIGPNNGPNTSDLNIEGRQLMSRPTMKSKVQKEEKVGVQVTVDGSGNVTGAKAVTTKSTTFDKNLWAEAEVFARKIKYNSRPDGKSVTAIIVIRFRP